MTEDYTIEQWLCSVMNEEFNPSDDGKVNKKIHDLVSSTPLASALKECQSKAEVKNYYDAKFDKETARSLLGA
jgi:hypothetical protein